MKGSPSSRPAWERGVREPGVKVEGIRKVRKVRKIKKAYVTADWTVADIVAAYPQATEVMAEYGLHCFGCAVNAVESLREGCLGHGFTADNIDALVADINESIAKTPPRPQTLTLTERAALAIAQIAKAEGKEGEGLSVEVDSSGQWYLEFRRDPDRGEKVFTNATVPAVRVFASILTLQRIGGSTIDERDGAFKLDLPESDAGTACGCMEEGCRCRGAKRSLH